MEQPIHQYAVTPGVGQRSFTGPQLALLAELAGTAGHVELTAFMQIIVRTTDGNLADQHQRLQAAGLSVYPVGPVVKSLQTCSFCSGEKPEGIPTAQKLDALVAGTPVPFTVRIGFSGCETNCAEALIRDIGVVTQGADRYDLYTGGRPGSLTPRLGQQVGEGLTSAQLLAAVQALLTCYREHAKGKERYWALVERLGFEPFRAAVAAAS